MHTYTYTHTYIHTYIQAIELKEMLVDSKRTQFLVVSIPTALATLESERLVKVSIVVCVCFCMSVFLVVSIPRLGVREAGQRKCCCMRVCWCAVSSVISYIHNTTYTNIPAEGAP